MKLSKLVRALYWLLAGFRALKYGLDPQLDEAMNNIWYLADELAEEEALAKGQDDD